MIPDFVYYTLIGVAASYVFYKWATINDKYFADRNLKHLKPKFLVGNTFGLLMNRYAAFDFISSVYSRFPKETCVLFACIYCC